MSGMEEENKKDTIGQWLLDRVCEKLNLMEKDYFGLRYVDAEKQRHWLDPLKTVYKQLKGVNPMVLCFRVKFYAEDPMKLHEEITRYYLFLQLRRDLHHGRLLCAPEDAISLAAYIVQSEVGDYDPQDHQPGYISEFKMLPKQTPKLEERVMELHKSLHGQVPSDAEANFLRKACTLDTYGVDPHQVKDQRGDQLYLGITHQGIMTFRGSRRTQLYKWGQIRRIAYEGKMFIAHVSVNEDEDAGNTKKLKNLINLVDEQQQPVKRDNPTEVHWLATAGHNAAGTVCRFVKLFKLIQSEIEAWLYCYKIHMVSGVVNVNIVAGVVYVMSGVVNILKYGGVVGVAIAVGDWEKETAASGLQVSNPSRSQVPVEMRCGAAVVLHITGPLTVVCTVFQVALYKPSAACCVRPCNYWYSYSCHDDIIIRSYSQHVTLNVLTVADARLKLMKPVNTSEERSPSSKDGYPFDEFLISKKQLETCLFACRSSSLPNFARRNTGNSRNSTISHKDVSTLNDSVQDTALRMH
ncbi:hypothetical protein C0Q70_20048 [Pomacea canaliculata]|uniref:FERM domain-containing protein n=1 Tax=Pomacea canaliculata TaxID=400727 RepID=A0A2T7NEE8_POMCA|nr:hypothetical protein C0Q70_20048 [Pomacea canaliculata]